MGYTHYWDELPESVTPNMWNRFASQVRALISKSRIPIGKRHMQINDFDGNDWSNVKVLFEDEDRYPQTFILNFDRNGSEWCKTNRYRYDSLVISVLTLAHHTLGLNVNASDGSYSDWLRGVKVLNRALNTNYKPPSNLLEKNRVY